MKSIIAILLLVTMAVQAFSKWIVILEYEINKDYIARNLCVNRAKPSCCKGKCFLQKKLAAEDDQQQSSGRSASRQDAAMELFLYMPEHVSFQFAAWIQAHNFFYLNGKSQEFTFSFFQPPRC